MGEFLSQLGLKWQHDCSEGVLAEESSQEFSQSSSFSDVVEGSVSEHLGLDGWADEVSIEFAIVTLEGFLVHGSEVHPGWRRMGISVVSPVE